MEKVVAHGEVARDMGCVALDGMQSSLVPRVKGILRGEAGQGTTEYAILVGVLVVIAILAIIAFRGKVQELWDAITTGINSL